MKNKKEVQDQVDIVIKEMEKLGGMLERFSHKQKELYSAIKILIDWKKGIQDE